MCPALETLCG